jgi:CheY-like chemotaxis protein
MKLLHGRRRSDRPVVVTPRGAVAPQPAPPKGPDPTGIHACIIWRDAEAQRLVAQKLRQHGAIVSVYESAQAAAADAVLVDLIAFAPTVFICDLSTAGLGRLRFMRCSPAFPPEHGRIPAIAITDFYQDFASVPVLEAVFDAYLVKPINLDNLWRLVTELATGAQRPVIRGGPRPSSGRSLVLSYARHNISPFARPTELTRSRPRERANEHGLSLIRHPGWRASPSVDEVP